VAAADLFDDQAQHALVIRLVQLARDHGALTVLPVALNSQSTWAEVAAGRFDDSTACFAEASEISAATGNPGVVGSAGVAEVYELAWRSRQPDARRVAAEVAREATDAGRVSQSIWVQYCLTVLELGLGNYEAALQYALGVYEDDAPFIGTAVLPELVEAASPRRRRRSPGSSARARATATSPRSCSSAPPPSTTTCVRCTGRPA